MTALKDLEHLVKDGNGEPYGQGYALMVGSEFAPSPFIINLSTTPDGEVLVVVVRAPDVDEAVFDMIAGSFEEGMREALLFLADRAEDVVWASEALI